MSDDEIIDIFDTSNITLAELSRMTGRSVKDLKRLIMNAPARKRGVRYEN